MEFFRIKMNIPELTFWNVFTICIEVNGDNGFCYHAYVFTQNHSTGSGAYNKGKWCSGEFIQDNSYYTKTKPHIQHSEIYLSKDLFTLDKRTLESLTKYIVVLQ